MKIKKFTLDNIEYEIKMEKSLFFFFGSVSIYLNDLEICILKSKRNKDLERWFNQESLLKLYINYSTRTKVKQIFIKN